MDETMSEIQWNTTTSTSDSLLCFTTNTSWEELDLAEWPKGVKDYSIELKYIPKWHILLGYKAQIDHMWK